MAPEGFVVPLEEQASIIKKTAVSRSWAIFSNGGGGSRNEQIKDLDKYAIMDRVSIHARDLRILDPLLSYPSAILGRERAIVINLEHIKAIITAEEVLLRDPSDDNVVPVVEELRRRLLSRPKTAVFEKQQVAVDDDDQSGGAQNDTQSSEEDEFPFEFRAMEVILEGICTFLDARTTELETEAYPALDELTSKVNKLKSLHRSAIPYCKYLTPLDCWINPEPLVCFYKLLDLIGLSIIHWYQREGMRRTSEIDCTNLIDRLCGPHNCIQIRRLDRQIEKHPSLSHMVL